MTRPDFFLVGAPKCGTSLMDTYLKRHPDLFMPIKELHYFGADLHFNTPARTEENYLSFFRDVPAGRRAGESSTWPLYSRTAAREIKAFCANAQILIMLRNPVSMLHSLHSHLLFTGNEDIADFGEALAAEPDRRAGRRIPGNSFPTGALLYRDVARFSEQVERYYEVFGRERVKVILADDFRKDPAAVYRDTLAFLGARTDFPGFDELLKQDAWTRNENKAPRSRMILRFLKWPTNQAVLRQVIPSPVPGWRFVLRALRRLNIQYGERAPMTAEVKAMLTEEFKPEVARLGALLGRDLSHWSKG